MVRKGLVVSFLAVVGVLAFAACSLQKKPSTARDPTNYHSSNSCAMPENPKKILRVNFTREPPTIDTRKGGDVTSSTLQFMLYEGLTKMTPHSSHDYGIAESISLSEDKKTYTFKLRQAQWSDGSSITSHDIAASWLDMLDPDFPAVNAGLLFSIQGAKERKQGQIPRDLVSIETPDQSTLVVHLENPTPYFLEVTSFCSLFPAQPKNLQALRDLDHVKDKSKLLFNGPYRLSEWIPGNRIVLEKNPYYWNRDQVRLDQITISLVSDEMTAYRMYENNELDLIGHPFSQIPLDLSAAIASDEHLSSHPIAGSSMCLFNTNDSMFSNKHLRRAFALAIHRQSIVDHITSHNEEIALGNIPPLLKKHRQGPLYDDCDLSEARHHFASALEELQIEKNAVKPTLTFALNQQNKRIAEALQQQWFRAFGIETKLIGVEFKAYLDRMHTKNFQFALGNWVVQFNDSLNIFERFIDKNASTNPTGWENASYKTLISKSYLANTEEQREMLLDQAEKIMVDEMPLTSLFFWNLAFLKSSEVQNVYVSPIGSIHLENVDIAVINT